MAGYVNELLFGLFITIWSIYNARNILGLRWKLRAQQLSWWKRILAMVLLYWFFFLGSMIGIGLSFYLGLYFIEPNLLEIDIWFKLVIQKLFMVIGIQSVVAFVMSWHHHTLVCKKKSE